MGIGRAGRYELLARLGEGGMAELFLARPIGDRGQHVFVLKRILPKHAHDRKFVAMFMRELDIASVVCHANLVSVVDHGEADGHYFMVMEYVHGTDLAQLLDACADADLQLPIAVAMTIVQQASRGLHALHEQVDRQGGKPKLVHRDVTPSNVMLSYEGAVKVTDFGIATATAYTRTTDAGTVKGKMGYLSPEQCRGDVLDRRSDVYALGILLYEATVGQRLFVADNDYAMMNLIVSGRFDRPSKRRSGYPPGLEAIVMRALETDASRRYATAADLADALERFAAASGLKLGAGVVAAWCGGAVPHRPYPHSQVPVATGPVAPVAATP
ncbi:MAG: serine/threonine-protein kinase, partial [Myxococcota bacterium]